MARIKLGTRGPEAESLYPASHRYARLSARKARLVMNLIRGEGVESALSRLRFSQKRGAPMIRKVVESAVANATQKAGLEPENLVVHRAYADEGPTMKRWRPRSMGRAYPRLKRSCHLTVVLTGAAAPAETAPAETGGTKGADKQSEPGDQES